jgi:hypothetical protein
VKRSHLRAISKKRARRITEEKPLRDAYLKAHRYCEAKRAGAPGACFGALHCHEVLSRAQGGSTGDPENLRSVCDFHNTAIAQDVETMRWAVGAGFRKSRAV